MGKTRGTLERERIQAAIRASASAPRASVPTIAHPSAMPFIPAAYCSNCRAVYEEFCTEENNKVTLHIQRRDGSYKDAVFIINPYNHILMNCTSGIKLDVDDDQFYLAEQRNGRDLWRPIRENNCVDILSSTDDNNDNREPCANCDAVLKKFGTGDGTRISVIVQNQPGVFCTIDNLFVNPYYHNHTEETCNSAVKVHSDGNFYFRNFFNGAYTWRMIVASGFATAASAAAASAAPASAAAADTPDADRVTPVRQRPLPTTPSVPKKATHQNQTPPPPPPMPPTMHAAAVAATSSAASATSATSASAACKNCAAVLAKFGKLIEDGSITITVLNQKGTKRKLTLSVPSCNNHSSDECLYRIKLLTDGKFVVPFNDFNQPIVEDDEVDPVTKFVAEAKKKGAKTVQHDSRGAFISIF